MLTRLSFLFGLLLLFAACSEAFHPFPPHPAGSESDESLQHLAQGYTPCNDYPDPTYGVICHPNQYCGHQGMGWCFRGCLSEDNCTENQVCVKDGRDVGTCISEEEYAARNRGEDLDPGFTACGDPASSRFSICQPGQYCASAYWGSCELGCLSEVNCTENQICEKDAGEHLGICISH